MHGQYERYFVHLVLTTNCCGEHKHLGTDENACRYCRSYHLSLALIVLATARLPARTILVEGAGRWQAPHPTRSWACVSTPVANDFVSTHALPSRVRGVNPPNRRK